jgi:hypothetical protein
MKHAILWLSLLLAAGPAAPQDDTHPIRMPGTPERSTLPTPPWTTGAQLLRMLEPPAGAPDRQRALDAGLRYLMGVHDATESREWCYTRSKATPAARLQPDAMRAKVVAGLRQLRPDQLARNAAPLVVRIWQWDWPCPPEGCCRD